MPAAVLHQPDLKLRVHTRVMPADLTTPLLLFLSLRDRYTDPVLLESNEARDSEHFYSFLGLETLASFQVDSGNIYTHVTGRGADFSPVRKTGDVTDALQKFVQSFDLEFSEEDNEKGDLIFNGLIGHTNFEGVQYFDTLEFPVEKKELRSPEIRYHLYRFYLVYHHFRDQLTLIENCPADSPSRLDELVDNIKQRGAVYPFTLEGEESSNLTDQEFIDLVAKGRSHCKLGDVFQIVLSRRFQRSFKGDDFQVYRALRSINPSPYLFYFDYGDYRIMGSSPEAQLVIKDGIARLNPIAGTYKRTGNDEVDQAATQKLLEDPKENAEHVMLVDLARNDLSRHTKKVQVKSLREVHHYSHVIHLVSAVEGELPEDADTAAIFGDTFPAGTLSGAPKYKALELISKYEKQQRGFYGGAIGFLDFNGDINQAILIRSFFSQNNVLYYQAGAGVVDASVAETELKEVDNKLGALRKALSYAERI
ncbi:MAG: anthranilate synthase component I family protein [Bacteroidota bacterium]